MEDIMKLIDRIERCQLMVAVRTDNPENAYKAAEACIKGGVKLIEITFSVPEAEEVIKKLSSNNMVTVGAGTVLSIPDAKKALKAGAAYIVSPNFDEEIVKFTRKEGALSIPGACTPTEIYRAFKAGGDIIKLFPFVEIGGLGFLKVIRGPLPFVKYMLSGGVNLDNISEYLSAKASCILVGSAVIKHELVMAEDWPSITELSRRFIQKIDNEVSASQNLS
jgi:2-dehydro-3-deoxyphosphogluconate aldolase/(4S)-4-hydroxy-2-oxoglutarate aldolase